MGEIFRRQGYVKNRDYYFDDKITMKLPKFPESIITWCGQKWITNPKTNKNKTFKMLWIKNLQRAGQHWYSLYSLRNHSTETRRTRPDQPAQAESGHFEKTLKVHRQREVKDDGEWDFILKTNVLFASFRECAWSSHLQGHKRSAGMTMNDWNKLQVYWYWS